MIAFNCMKENFVVIYICCYFVELFQSTGVYGMHEHRVFDQTVRGTAGLSYNCISFLLYHWFDTNADQNICGAGDGKKIVATND